MNPLLSDSNREKLEQWSTREGEGGDCNSGCACVEM